MATKLQQGILGFENILTPAEVKHIIFNDKFWRHLTDEELNVLEEKVRELALEFKKLLN